MSHSGLLLKIPIHLCTLQLPSLTSHHSKKFALNKLNKWTVLPSILREEAQQAHLLNSTSGFSTLPAFHNCFKVHGTQWDKEIVALYVPTPGRYPGGWQYCSARPVPATASIHQKSKTWRCPETWDLPMLNLDLPVDPWAPTKLFPF